MTKKFERSASFGNITHFDTPSQLQSSDLPETKAKYLNSNISVNFATKLINKLNLPDKSEKRENIKSSFREHKASSASFREEVLFLTFYK